MEEDLGRARLEGGLAQRELPVEHHAHREVRSTIGEEGVLAEDLYGRREGRIVDLGMEEARLGGGRGEEEEGKEEEQRPGETYGWPRRSNSSHVELRG